MNAAIYNVNDLRSEIDRLKQVKTQQEELIKQHFNSPRSLMGTIASLFSRSKAEPDGPTVVVEHDLIGYLSKIFLPLTLNKTLFRKSGFVVRALVRLISGKASHFINDKTAGTAWDKVVTLLPESIQEKVSPQKKRKSLLGFLSGSNRKNRAAK